MLTTKLLNAGRKAWNGGGDRLPEAYFESRRIQPAIPGRLLLHVAERSWYDFSTTENQSHYRHDLGRGYCFELPTKHSLQMS